MRPIYYLGTLYVTTCVALLVHVVKPDTAPTITPIDPGNGSTDPALQWFERVRPYCNPVEVHLSQKYETPPATEAGAAYSAACYGLAGELTKARQAILSVDPRDRWRAAGVVFGIAHPVADAGDDRAAGPMMELVLEFWPNHYMAQYHAGMANYAIGQQAKARRFLTDFLATYRENDGWTRNANDVLQRLTD